VKKIGDYVVRSQVTSADSGGDRIQLFDGRFDTGYKITKFEISYADRDDNTSVIASAKLTTEPSTDNANWNWGKVTEVAWASAAWDANGLSTQAPTTIIDPDNMIVEDLYISVKSIADPQEINYIIHFEKYEFAAYDGAGFLIKNNSQAGPQ
jgi:hypothetical protein